VPVKDEQITGNYRRYAATSPRGKGEILVYDQR
jgi:hypothetical protein